MASCLAARSTASSFRLAVRLAAEPPVAPAVPQIHKSEPGRTTFESLPPEADRAAAGLSRFEPIGLATNESGTVFIPVCAGPSFVRLLTQGGRGIKRWPCGRGTGSLGQVRPNRRVIASGPSDSPTGMSKRTGSITCFSGTRKGVLTNGPARPSGGHLEPKGRLAKRNLRGNPTNFRHFKP